MNDQERYSRQRDIVPSERLAQCRATVIGIGAIGRQVALQLAAMGIPWLELIDFDLVEESNLASQGYLQDDLDKQKVHATADYCRQINHDLVVHVTGERFRRSMDIGDIVFVCVDSIDTRHLIWEALKETVSFLTDGRMSAEVLRVLTVCDSRSREYYPTTLFTAEQAYVGPCTAKTTIFCANIAAGMMVAQFAKYLRCMPIDTDVQLNLLSMELIVNSS